MPLSSFTNGTLPNVNAMLEQECLVNAVYSNRQDLAQAVLDATGGGSILAWNYNDTGLPVSYMIARQGSTVVVAIAGTQNAQQAVQDVMGAFSTNTGPNGSVVHGFFNSQASLVQAQLAEVIGPNLAGNTLLVSGHSLGAAAGFILAQNYAQNWSSDNVSWMGFGSPKSYTSQFAGTLPSSAWLIAGSGDPVPYLPPSGLKALIAKAALGLSPSLPTNWQHFCSVANIDSSGNITSGSTDNYNIPSNSTIASAQFDQHRMNSYASSIETAWQSQVGSGQDLPLITLSQTLRSSSPQNFVQQAISAIASINIQYQNSVAYGGDSQPVLSPQNVSSVGTISGSVNCDSLRFTANNIGSQRLDGVSMATIQGSGVYNLRLFFSNGQQGSSEGMVWNGGSSASLQDALVMATRVANQRATLLGNDGQGPGTNGTAAITYVRASDANNPRLSLLSGYLGMVGPANSGGRVVNSGSPALHCSTQLTCVNAVTVGSNTTQYLKRRNLMLSFPPSSVINGPNFNSAGLLGNGLNYLTQAGAYVNFLTAASNNLGCLGINISSMKQPVIGFSWVTPPGYILKLNVPNHGLNSLDLISLTHCDVKGFNGRYRIQVVDANNITLNHRFNTTGPLPTQAFVQRVGSNGSGDYNKSFYQFATWTQGNFKLQKRDPAKVYVPLTFRHRHAARQ